jgi:hypothetical protein
MSTALARIFWTVNRKAVQNAFSHYKKRQAD